MHRLILWQALGMGGLLVGGGRLLALVGGPSAAWWAGPGGVLQVVGCLVVLLVVTTVFLALLRRAHMHDHARHMANRDQSPREQCVGATVGSEQPGEHDQAPAATRNEGQ